MYAIKYVLASVVLIIMAFGTSVAEPNLQNEFNFDKVSPIEFIDYLRERARKGQTSLTIWKPPSKGWLKENHLSELVTGLDSVEECANVVSFLSSYREKSFSKCGDEAAYLILGFQEGNYPPRLNSLTDRGPAVDASKIKKWYANRPQKHVD